MDDLLKKRAEKLFKELYQDSNIEDIINIADYIKELRLQKIETELRLEEFSNFKSLEILELRAKLEKYKQRFESIESNYESQLSKETSHYQYSEWQLKKSELRNKSILASIPHKVFILDNNGTILDYSFPHIEKLYLPPEKFLNKNVIDILPQNASCTILDAVKKAVQTQETIIIEFSLPISKNITFYEAKVVPYLVQKAIIITHDITERKHTEEKLNKYKEHLEDLVNDRTALLLKEIEERKKKEMDLEHIQNKTRMLFDKNPFPTLVFNLDTLHILEVNDEAIRSYGYSKEEFLQMNLFDLKTEDYYTDLLIKIDKLKKEKSITIETKHKKKDQSIIDVRVTANILEDFYGKKTVIVICQNITEQKKAENLLQIQNKAIESSTNGIIITDPNLPDNPIIYVNPAFTRVTGYLPEDVIGKNCRILNQKDRQQKVLKKIRNAIKEGHNVSGIVRNFRKDGEYFWNELNISPIFNSQSKITHFVGIMNDFTKQKLVNNQLIENQAKLDLLEKVFQIAIIEWNLLSNKIYFSSILHNLLGYTEAESIIDYPTFIQKIHPEDVVAFKNQMDLCVKKIISSFELEYRLQNKSGFFHQVKCRGLAIYNEKLEPQKIISVLYDI